MPATAPRAAASRRRSTRPSSAMPIDGARLDAAMRPAGRLLFRRTGVRRGERLVAVETAVAISYGGSTQAVLMASPADLDDFAVGFTLTEGIVDDAAEIEAVERLDLDQGIELQVTLAG